MPGHAHPLIRFLDGLSGRRASLVGSGLDVWEVIATVRDNEGSIEEAAAYLRMPIQLVQARRRVLRRAPRRDRRGIELNEAEYRRGFEAAATDERAPRG